MTFMKEYNKEVNGLVAKKGDEETIEENLIRPLSKEEMKVFVDRLRKANSKRKNAH